MEYHSSKLSFTLNEPGGSELEKDVQVLELQGEMDSYTLSLNRDKILEIAQNLKVKTFVMHFGGIKYVNSESISFLIQLNQILEEKGKQLIIVQAQQNVFDVFKVIGLFEGIKYYSSLAEFYGVLQKNK